MRKELPPAKIGYCVETNVTATTTSSGKTIGYKLSIPNAISSSLGITNDSICEWLLEENGVVRLTFRKSE